jgi:hypothetical protein
VQVTELDGVNGLDFVVQVKWVFGAQATPERIALLHRATPYMIDFARQLCGAKVWVQLVTIISCFHCLI